ncbi:MAG: hypothetical protein J5781_05590 [Clostridia bacterium]|nr:hypothetical protein [Clostridia bacterium]
MEQEQQKKSAWQDFKEGLKTAPKGKKGRFTVDFINTHEDLRQFVLFSLFSFLCFAAEMASFYSVYYICMATGFDAPLKWFVFDYSAAESGGKGGFLAFLLSTAIAQALTFILNRKKTFKANNNVVWAATMYAIMVVVIIVANTALCGIIKDGIAEAMLKGNCSQSATDFVSGTVSKMTGGALAWIIAFLMSKFVIMKKKKDPEKGNTENAA